MTFEAAPDLRQLRTGAILNTASGSCEADAQQELDAILAEAGVSLAKTWCGGGEVVGPALEEAGSQALDFLIVLGGDGTIRSAAETCTDKGPLLMPLPGGTMNMLPKALYGDVTWQTALRSTLTAPAIQPVNAGRIGDKQFFVAAILGAPSLWGEAREAMREGDVGRALGQGLEALKHAFKRDLRYAFDGQRGEAEAVSVLCPLTSKALADDAAVLEAAVLTHANALDAMRLATTFMFSDWRQDPDVVTAKVRRIEVESAGSISAILDGETMEFAETLTVDFVAAAFKAVVPAER